MQKKRLRRIVHNVTYNLELTSEQLKGFSKGNNDKTTMNIQKKNVNGAENKELCFVTVVGHLYCVTQLFRLLPWSGVRTLRTADGGLSK